MADSRRSFRRVVRLPVRLQVADNPSQIMTALTRDISTTGAYLEGVGAKPGDTLNLVIAIGEKEIQLKGLVVRHEPEGLGVQFSAGSREASEVLTALIASVFDPHLVSFD